jgi:hypothetical protein
MWVSEPFFTDLASATAVDITASTIKSALGIVCQFTTFSTPTAATGASSGVALASSYGTAVERVFGAGAGMLLADILGCCFHRVTRGSDWDDFACSIGFVDVFYLEGAFNYT